MRWPWHRAVRIPVQDVQSPPSFAEALAAAEREALVAPRLVDVLAQTRLALDGITHLEGAGDPTALHHWVDELSHAVVETIPGSLCRDGCHHCCHYPTAFFDLYPGEWEPIAHHLRTTWSPARLEAFLERFAREHGPYLGLIRLLEYGLRGMFRFHPTARLLPLSCPFLEDARCSIYDVRPFACRAFGHFSARIDDRDLPHVYGCKDQEQALLPALRGPGPRIQLPDIMPLWERLASLTGGHRHVLATWLDRTWRVPVVHRRTSWTRILGQWLRQVWFDS
jgi:Fe-S-cluster containining protein